MPSDKPHPPSLVCPCPACAIIYKRQKPTDPGLSPELVILTINADRWATLISESRSLPHAVIQSIQRLHGALYRRGYTRMADGTAQQPLQEGPKPPRKGL